MCLVLNLTPHPIKVYGASQFVNLEQLNPTTWVADGVEGEPLAAYPESYPGSGGARIATSVEEIRKVDATDLPGVVVQTKYGEATGIPDWPTPDVSLIVSLPMQSMAIAAGHPLAKQMAAPYKVVRLRSNTSTVLGCMGFTFQ